MKYAIPKGLFDIVPYTSDPDSTWQLSHRWQYVESLIREVADCYGFQEIRTPLFERTELFTRTVGEASDIVSKEMYTFLDKGDRSMTLRPEGTAAVLRAYLEHQFHQRGGGVSKLYYLGPMFRYERPQAGRYRQHHQFGAECVGIASPEQDAEMIDFLHQVYRKLGLQHLVVHLNSVGDAASRHAYREALVHFLTPQVDRLSSESQIRFQKNVLRILDSKDAGDQAILEGAPSIVDFLSPDSRNHFARLQELLAGLKIQYIVNPKLVRGLDYYHNTVFETLSEGLAVGGGGRYDGLLASLGGPPLPGVGFGTGMERILHVMEKEHVPFPDPRPPELFFVPLGEESKERCLTLATDLRHQGFRIDLDLSGKKVQHGLQLAHSLGAIFCIVVGERELGAPTVEVKTMRSRETTTIPWDNLAPFLNQWRQS